MPGQHGQISQQLYNALTNQSFLLINLPALELEKLLLAQVKAHSLKQPMEESHGMR
jgi:hypothetical protein